MGAVLLLLVGLLWLCSTVQCLGAITNRWVLDHA